MKFSDYCFEYDELVVGSSLKALIYAYCKNLPVIFSSFKLPCYIDFFEPECDLSHLGLDNQVMSLQTVEGEKLVGSLKVDLWKRLMFFLSLAGNIPMSNKTNAIRLEREDTLKATTYNSRFARFKFKNLIVFDEEIAGMPNALVKLASKEYKVIDWMHIKSGKQQIFDYFKTDDSLVNEIYLYPSDQIDGDNFRLKDAVAVSYLTDEQIRDFEYSDTYVRFKTTKIFKEAGMRGRKNGRSKENPNLHKYYALKVETTKRELFNLNYDIYKDSENIKFNYQPLEELLKLEPAISQPDYLRNMLLER